MQSDSDLRTLARKVGFDPAYLEAFEAKMFIQGPKTARRLTNFFVLLLLYRRMFARLFQIIRTEPPAAD